MDGNNPNDATALRKAKACPPVSQLVRLLWGEDTAELQMSVGHIPHVAMYLSLNLDSVSSKEEVSLHLRLLVPQHMLVGVAERFKAIPVVFVV